MKANLVKISKQILIFAIYLDAVQMELPDDFVKEMRETLPEGDAEGLIEAIGTEPCLSIRLNPFKAIAPDELLSRSGMSVSGYVPWSSLGLYLNERPSFTMNPLFHAGTFYVQEASSMFLEQLVRSCVNGPVRALDLCAAPGGKSTHLRTILPKGSVLVANEINHSRANVLAENMVKWGHPEIVVTNDTPERIGASSLLFDLILVDAPCSGEGMFRKDSVAVSEWSLQNVRMCAQRQRDILSSVWPSLRPGGYLIYSTCTYNRLEDEDNVLWISEELGAEMIPVEVPESWNIAGDVTGRNLPVYHFFPNRTRGEGFFIALLRKNGDSTGQTVRGFGKAASEADGIFRDWVDSPDDYLFQEHSDTVRALPSQSADFMLRASSELHTLAVGVELAVRKGRDWAPSHPLAMSRILRSDAFPSVEVSLQQAVAYLHSESIVLTDAPRGFVLLKYAGVPLGFVKNVGNRANNLYPQQWRIRKSV